MRAVVQRVTRAAVRVEGRETGSIGEGLVVLVSVAPDDHMADVGYLADKIANLRIFSDDQGRMNLSLLDTGGAALVISQFTLHGDCRKGRRPSFTGAALPELAEALYDSFGEQLEALGVAVQTGVFGATMLVEIHNHGPVTMLLDSRRLF